MTHILKKCRNSSAEITEPENTVNNPNPTEVDRLRGFGLIGLTDQRTIPSHKVIKDRSTALRLDNAFCHSSPDKNVCLASSNYY
jgi:hypothetical protein